MKIISIRENPLYKEKAIEYFQSKWPEVVPVIYEDSISHAINSESILPQWYLLEKENEIIGCAGLITNDFISRMDLYPWLCALFIDEKYRGNKYSRYLIEQAKKDAIKVGFDNLYLSTGHKGLYEKYGFEYTGQGYHPWNEESRIYVINLKPDVGRFIIRQETSEDYNKVYDLIEVSFMTANVKDGDEQDFAVKLREGSGYIPELALVAERGEKLIGHIMFTKTYIELFNGDRMEALLLAPVSVLLEYRDQKVGSGLINEGMRLAKEMGYKAVFLCGDPGYYNRFGFISISNYRIKSKNNIPEQFIMTYEIEHGILKNISGFIEIC